MKHPPSNCEFDMFISDNALNCLSIIVVAQTCKIQYILRSNFSCIGRSQLHFSNQRKEQINLYDIRKFKRIE